MVLLGGAATDWLSPSSGVIVEKAWIVDGVTYPEGTQPSQFVAGLYINGVSLPWGVGVGIPSLERETPISVDETTTIEAQHCSVVSKRVTSVNGGSANASLPFDPVIPSGEDWVIKITNTVACEPSAVLDKSAGMESVDSSGDVITYTLTARALGGLTLTDVVITDPHPGLSALSCSPDQPATLESYAVLTCTATYTVTQADLDSLVVENVATATGTPPGQRPVTEYALESVATVQLPVIEVAKAADVTSVDAAGDVIKYKIDAVNAGNVTLSDVSITDPLASAPALSCTPHQPAMLTPGERLTCTTAYTVTAADIEAGGVRNTATAIGSPPGRRPVSATSAATVPVVAEKVPPSSPRDVRMQPGDRRITATWASPTSPGSSAITGYKVTASPGGAICATSGLSCVVTGLTNGQPYTISVVALSPAGESPPAFSSAVAIPKPYVRVGVKAVRDQSRLRIDVNPNMGKGYWTFQVQRQNARGSWKPLKTYKTQGTKETRTINLPKGTYRVVVRAKYGFAETASSPVYLKR